MEQNKMDLASELFYVGVYNNLLEKEQHESLINLCNSNIIFEKQAIINSKLQEEIDSLWFSRSNNDVSISL